MNTTAGFQNSYRGKKVLLTGHTGFKGSWMLAWLHQLGAEVKGYALTPENPNDLFSLINGNGLCESVIADIRDKERLTKEILSFKPDFIFHLAAQPLVRRSYEQPLYTFEVNVLGTANLLDAVKLLSNNCSIVIITTDKVYENIEQHYAYKEDDKLGGHDPYSASKAAAEIVVNSYRDSFFKHTGEKTIGIASARAGNVIGGGDRSKDRIIPDIIKGLENNESVLVRNPVSVRPWQHVLEPLSGYLLIGSKLKEDIVAYSEAWNIGPETEDILTVKQVVEKAIATYGKGEYHTPQLTNQPHEATLLQLDISKTKQRLNWEPLLNSSSAIEWTMQWYKQVMNGVNPLELTNRQINEYSQL
jgi:CDP-glucose 4,6-dehydratase